MLCDRESSPAGCCSIAVGKAEWPLHEGKTFFVSNKQIELERPLTKSQYLSGQCFGAYNITTGSASASSNTAKLSRQFVPLKINSSLIPNPSISVESKQGTHMQALASLPTAQDHSVIQEERLDPKYGTSHWTANWYVMKSLVFIFRRWTDHITGGSNKPKSTRLGMVMRISHALGVN